MDELCVPLSDVPPGCLQLPLQKSTLFVGVALAVGEPLDVFVAEGDCLDGLGELLAEGEGLLIVVGGGLVLLVEGG